MEKNGVISLNEHARSLEKVTTVKRVAQVFRDLTAQLIIIIITIIFLAHQHKACRQLKIKQEMTAVSD